MLISDRALGRSWRFRLQECEQNTSPPFFFSPLGLLTRGTFAEADETLRTAGVDGGCVEFMLAVD
jgi:hypothetical protein